MDNVLIIFAKAPEPGLAKTRLVPPLSLDEAAGLARAFISDMLDKAAAVPGVTVWLACTPDGSVPEFERLARGRAHAVVAQEGDGLGERMARAFYRAFASGAKKAAVVGTDIPTLPARHISELFGRLDGCDVVIGPAKDGGYYIIGMKADYPGLFEGVTWSGPDVYGLTLEKAAGLGLKVEGVPAQVDVDTVDDLVSVMGKDLPPNTKKAVDALKDRVLPFGRTRPDAGPGLG